MRSSTWSRWSRSSSTSRAPACFVLDVGAFVGDTALYYARRGAFVVAVEPVPGNFELMLRNLELNPDLKSGILPINAAVGGEDGFVELSCELPWTASPASTAPAGSRLGSGR